MMHKRMGDDIYQEKVVTLEVVYILINGLECEFKGTFSNWDRE